MTDKVTRRDVAKWLDHIHFQLDRLMRAPAGEIKARVALLQQRVSRWRGQVGRKRKDGKGSAR